VHAINVAELEACAKQQGVVFRQGDILLLRIGFIQKYYASTREARDELSTKPETLSVATLDDLNWVTFFKHFCIY
jgi:hypothetical protein